MPSLSACRCPALHVPCCPRPPLFSCRRPRRRCRRAPLLLNQSSSPDAVITIYPLVPPSFVDCYFKRRTKPLLPTMVPSLSSRLPSLVGCFRCPPPFTLAASHGRRHHQSVTLTAGASTSPSSSPGPPVVFAMPPAVEQRAIAIVAAAAAAAVGDSPPPHCSRERRLPPSRVVLRLAVGDETSCSPRRDPEIPRDRTRCPTSLHRKPPPLPPPPQSTPPTADSVESTMPRSSETFMRSAQTGAIARAARRTAWWNLMWIVIIGLRWGQPRD